MLPNPDNSLAYDNPARGVLVVAHDPRIIPFANRIIHIEDGRIVGVEPGGAGSNSK